MNWYGCYTLFTREVRRFLNVNMQTIVAPALTAVMYLIVFSYAMGDRQVPGMEVDYFNFLIPGLVMMAMLQNAFANTSSSIMVGKLMNVQIILMMAPLSALELIVAFLSAAVVRAVIVGVVLLLVLVPFTHIPIGNIGFILFYGICGSIIMGAMGLIGGMWSKTFDDMALLNNFIIMPLTFLSGVFYSVKQLPEMWQSVNHWNPFFYLIDGFRFGFLGVGDTDPYKAMSIVLIATLISIAACLKLWSLGWRLKE
ncbi:MAG: metal-dependent hydrolase [Zetaproteobacteria bacterium CG2_30_46_52]|nr:MAG: metal-dependent hydrolase [Zetaproteobacteria bacterium CG2_30_46_52]